jgi:hypothetical protein
LAAKLGEPPLVGVENVDQLQQRAHPLRVGGAERHPGQALAALHAEQVGHRDQHTGLSEHGMRLGFEARAQRDDLRAVAHQFAQLPSRWWGDPRLGQPVHPQQVRQIAGVTDVFSELENDLDFRGLQGCFLLRVKGFGGWVESGRWWCGWRCR